MLGVDVLKLCRKLEADKKEIVFNRQICTFAIEYVKYKMFIENNAADVVAGFSLGEYMALLAAQIIDIEQACALVKLRARLFNDFMCDDVGDMLAVFHLSICQVDSICRDIGKKYIAISNYNSYEQVVVSGTMHGLEQFKEISKSMGGKTVPLCMNRPYHHVLMVEAANVFRNEVDKYKFGDATKPIIMNITGKLLSSKENIKEHIYKQIFTPVQWIETIRTMQKIDINQYYEISTNPFLCNFVKSITNSNTDNDSIILI